MLRRIAFLVVVAGGFAPSAVVAQDPMAQPRAVRTSDLVRVMPRRDPKPTQPIPEIRVRTEKFFNMLKEGKTSQAYDELLADERLGQQPQNVQLLLQKTEQALGLYGQLLSFEIYDNYTVGSRINVVTYLTFHPVQPLRWRFVFDLSEAA